MMSLSQTCTTNHQ